MNQPPRICIITGPTATGKTDSAIDFARAMNGEIVSADSMLVYRGMDIGTAKPTARQQAAVRHHMIDVADPAQPFSAAAWQQGALAAIEDILSRGKLPVVAGGTGLYVKSVLYPMDFAGTAANDAVREKWARYLADHGAQALHDALERIDPQSAAALPVGDTRRVMRALEIYEVTGQTKSEKTARDRQRPARYRALTMAVDLPRPILYERINQRVDQMMRQGLVQEVRGLLDSGLSAGTTAMQGLGYKEIAAYLGGEASLETAVETLKRRTRNFAKRQLTWFRADPSICWLHADRPCEKDQITAFFIENAKSFLFRDMM